MYYDCVEDESRGLAVMKKRIELAGEDIEKHFRFHQRALDEFLDMDLAVVDNDRVGLVHYFGFICGETQRYVERVKEHKERLGRDSFLVYPSCPPEHYFRIWQGDFVRELSFNPEGDSAGVNREIEEIVDILINAERRAEKIPFISMPLELGADTPCEYGGGLYDSSFRQNLSTTHLLLKRAGLEIEL